MQSARASSRSTRRCPPPFTRRARSVRRDGEPAPASPRAYADRGAAYRVGVDGRRAGRLKEDGELAVEVDAGRHEVVLRCFGMRSRALELEVGSDERVELVGEPHEPDSAGGVLKRMLSARDDYMVLRRA